MKMSTIKVEIFGKGCKSCDRLEENVRVASENSNVNVDIVKIKDQDEFIERGVFKTPGLAVNGKVVSTGRVLTPDKINEYLSGE